MSSTVILGGGIAGLSVASFLERPSIVLERDAVVGGLCRSYMLNGVAYDVGPHIIFSKNKEVLDLHTSMIDTNKIRRSNQIVYKGRLVKYPFENDLSKLPQEERDYCLKEFLSNPYDQISASNMLQFFLKTFGEGITRTYLQPYNEKIWKYDPSCMDTQMVERIPKPPAEDIIKSAEGVESEGYLHQLYFHYPSQGGFQSLVDAYLKEAEKKAQIRCGVKIQKMSRAPNGEWTVETSQGTFQASQLISCMPIHELFKYLNPPLEILQALSALKYNAIHIVMVQAKRDKIGNHFALYFPDKSVIFHRLSKLGFLGKSYELEGEATTLMAEITFRPGSYLSTLSTEEIQRRVIEDLERVGYVDAKEVFAVETRSFPYAYVIYDLDHRKNVDTLLGYLRSQGIESAGRFAEFEYLNSDQVVERTLALSRRLNSAPEIKSARTTPSPQLSTQ